jgi:hypothetical protein
MSEWIKDVWGLGTFVLTAVLVYQGIKQPSSPLHIILVMAALVAIVFSGYWNLKAVVLRHSPPDPKILPAVTTEQIYIGPTGMPVIFIGDKVAIDVRLFGCVALHLVHIRASVSQGNLSFSVADGEPMVIKAHQAVRETLERSLTPDEQLVAKDADLLLVQGKASFSGGLELPFMFQTHPVASIAGRANIKRLGREMYGQRLALRSAHSGPGARMGFVQATANRFPLSRLCQRTMNRTQSQSIAF